MATEIGVRVRVLAFARIRELLGGAERELTVPPGTTLEDVWERLAATSAELGALRASTRFARNGAIASGTAIVGHGDEIALLPPVGGG